MIYDVIWPAAFGFFGSHWTPGRITNIQKFYYKLNINSLPITPAWTKSKWDRNLRPLTTTLFHSFCSVSINISN